MKQKNYETSKIAINIVILSIHNKKLWFMSSIREKEPFKNNLELPGGLILKNETAEESLKRKCESLINTENFFYEQFFTFTEPKRDPRERIISIGYLTLIDKNTKIENKEFQWTEFNENLDLAFDHKEMIKKAKEHLKKNITPKIASNLIPKLFPLNKLQDVYEIIEDEKYDNRNFRKKMLLSKQVIETDRIETNVSHRPARLYKIKT